MILGGGGREVGRRRMKGLMTAGRTTILVRFLVLAAIGSLASTAGCEHQRGERLTAWELDVAGERTLVELPTQLDLPPREVPFALRSAVVLPADMRGQPLTLTIVGWRALPVLRLDGELVQPLQRPLDVGDRTEGLSVWRLPAEAGSEGTIALELLAKHTSAFSARLDTVPRLSRTDEDGWARLLTFTNRYGHYLGTFGIGLIGLLYLTLYLLAPGRPAFLYFAIQAICAAYYPFQELGLAHEVLGHHDTALMSVSISAAMVAAVWFAHDQFRLPPPSRWWTLPIGVSVVAASISLDPFVGPLWYGRVVALNVTAVGAYLVWVCARASRQPEQRPAAPLLLVSWIVIGATSWTDTAAYAGLGEALGGVRLASVGLFVFGMMQSVLISFEHTRSLRRSEALNVALRDELRAAEARGAEIELLNAELQRQIAARSGGLFDALAALSSASHAPPIAVGDVVEERYRIVREIGRGGMGVVYEVVRLTDDARFALKASLDIDGVQLARLAREARVAAQLTHPNVVSIVDIDVAASGFVYLILEYVEGVSLGEAAREGRGDGWLAGMLRQTADGLAALHAVDVTHRDLKPENVLVTAIDGREVAKITDFGISRVARAAKAVDVDPEGRTMEAVAPGAAAAPPTGDSSSLTRTGYVSGTPAYMAPESGRPESHLDPATDLFSFGVLICRLCTGRYPFPIPAINARLAGEAPAADERVFEALAAVSEGLAALARRCLDLDPAARPSAEEAAQTLAGLERELSATQPVRLS